VKRLTNLHLCSSESDLLLTAGDTKPPKPWVSGLKNPESVAVGSDGRVYISEIGELGKDGDGRIMVVGKDGKATPFATGLDDPKGIVAWTNVLYVADNKKVKRHQSAGNGNAHRA